MSGIQVANQSGFPFQIGVEHLVETSGSAWRVLRREHAWFDGNRGGYIDLVLQSADDRLLLECKRRQDAEWVFMSAASAPTQNLDFNFWVDLTDREVHSLRRSGWLGGRVNPYSHVAHFCTVRGSSGSGRDGVMLEPIASELASSLVAFGRAESAMDPPRPGSPRIYMAAIVTTAKLVMLEFNRREIDVSSGHLPADAKEHQVGYLRYQKQLIQHLNRDSFLGGIRRDSPGNLWEQTIWVVNVDHLEQFLRDVGIHQTTHVGLAHM